MTIIAHQLINKYDVYDSELPEGSGVFQIETQRNGKALDLMELRYDPSGRLQVLLPRRRI